ncbi:hypothetical protein PSAB6_410040 [Paraburkholderia sabiae]|nr:hypothetical protein PSAB6_410040 [Paraburkholderia sabiae]
MRFQRGPKRCASVVVTGLVRCATKPHANERSGYWQSRLWMLTIGWNMTSDESQPTGARSCTSQSRRRFRG